MNTYKWCDQDHSRELWMAKLGEEFGEVAREATKLASPEITAGKFAVTRKRLIDELEHVEFIAHCWRNQLLEGGGNGA